MKYIQIYDDMGLKRNDAVFDYFLENLVPTVNSWSYFVKWDKVTLNTEEIKINLNIMNSLLCSKDIERDFLSLANKFPEIIKLLPILVASRGEEYNVMTDHNLEGASFASYDINNMDENKAFDFANGTGIIQLLKEGKIKNLVDYVFGVEVGMDTNARKNRSGRAMEDILEYHIRHICEDIGAEYIRQATVKKVKNRWGLELAFDKVKRNIDFIIKINDILYITEVNYYSGQGSKIKATAGEYRDIEKFWKKNNHKFIWITDGYGWESTENAFSEAFEKIDYIFNLRMVYDGILKYVLENNL